MIDLDHLKHRITSSLRLRTMRYLGRSQVVRALARGRTPPRASVSSDMFPNVDVADAVRSLERDGLAFGFELPTSVVSELRAWEGEEPRYVNRDFSRGYLERDRARAEAKLGHKITLANFADTGRCPAVDRLRRDPVLAEIARCYIGKRARLISSTMWWSYPAPDASRMTKDQNAQLYHYDLDDFRFLKFFFYLTDVDDGAGPHAFMRGTHRKKKLEHLTNMTRYSDEQILGAYGSDAQRVVVGPAGTGFAADTFGFHKGVPPSQSPRLILQVLFAHYFYGWEDDVPRLTPARMLEL